VHNIFESSKEPKIIKLKFKRGTQQNYGRICSEKQLQFEKSRAILKKIKILFPAQRDRG
jgi:hypothetical protein